MKRAVQHFGQFSHEQPIKTTEISCTLRQPWRIIRRHQIGIALLEATHPVNVATSTTRPGTTHTTTSMVTLNCIGLRQQLTSLNPGITNTLRLNGKGTDVLHGINPHTLSNSMGSQRPIRTHFAEIAKHTFQKCKDIVRLAGESNGGQTSSEQSRLRHMARKRRQQVGIMRGKTSRKSEPTDRRRRRGSNRSTSRTRTRHIIAHKNLYALPIEAHHVVVTRMPRLDHSASQILYLPEHLRRHEPPIRLLISPIRSIGGLMIGTTRRLSIITAEPESPPTILRRTG